MKFLWLGLSCALLLTGCLDNLERLTTETRDEVIASKKAIHEATDHTGKLNILILLTGYDEPAARRDKAIAAIMAAPSEKIIGLGAPLPLADLVIPTPDGMAQLPNVVYVGKQSRPNLLITPVSPEIQRELAAAVLAAHLLLLRGQMDYPTLHAEQQHKVREQILKWSLVGAAVIGAKPVPSEDDPDGARAWPQTREQKADLEDTKAKFKDYTRGLHNFPGFSQEDRDRLELILEVKIDNRFDRLPKP